MMYENPDARETPGLEDYIAALRARWILVVALTTLVTLLAYMYVQTRTVTHEATAEVLVNPSPIGRTNQAQLPPVVLERERGVMVSERTAAEAAEIMGNGQSPAAILMDTRVEFEPSSDILAVKVKRADAELARDTSNAMAQAYVKLRNEEADAIDAVELAGLDEQIDELLATEAALREERDALNEVQARRPEFDPALGAQISALNTEITQLQIETRNFRAARTAAVTEHQTRGDAAEVLHLEEISEFSGIGDRTVYLAGFLAGLIASVSLAWLLDRLDRTARESDDVELAIGSKVLGSIPEFGLGSRSGSSAVVMLSSARSTRVQRAREAFRRLRSSVQFLAASNEHQSFVVTSARPAEGKSVTVTNLAVATAQSGASVVLVSADMRRPTMEKLLGLPNPDHGLATYLAGSDRADFALRVEQAPNLTVVPSGPLPSNPGELLASKRFGEFISELKKQFDFVMIDAPPVFSTADALSAAVHCDGVIVVVDSQHTDTDALLRVSSEIRRAGGQVVGAVLNKDKSESSGLFRKDRYAYEKMPTRVSQ